MAHKRDSSVETIINVKCYSSSENKKIQNGRLGDDQNAANPHYYSANRVEGELKLDGTLIGINIIEEKYFSSSLFY